MTEILVLFYSRHGATAALARQVCHGVDAVSGAQAPEYLAEAIARAAQAEAAE